MKFNKSTSVLFAFSIVSAIFTTACAAKPTENEDTRWIYESVENYNKQTIRQMISTTITETKGGTDTQESLSVYDSENELAYTESSGKSPNSSEEYQAMTYFYLEDGRGYVMMKTVDGGAASSDFRKLSAEKEFVEETFQSTALSLSEKATVKIVGDEQVDDRAAVKVEVSDPEFKRLLDDPKYMNIYENVKEAGKHEKELAKAYDAYTNMKEREWTIWFDKETHKPLKTETDSSVMYNLLYYITLIDVMDESQVPSQRITTSYITSDDACKKIELPSEYVEAN